MVMAVKKIGIRKINIGFGYIFLIIICTSVSLFIQDQMLYK